MKKDCKDPRLNRFTTQKPTTQNCAIFANKRRWIELEISFFISLEHEIECVQVQLLVTVMMFQNGTLNAKSQITHIRRSFDATILTPMSGAVVTEKCQS